MRQITGPDTDDGDDEILAGVGFGTNFYKLITKGKGASENYSYPHRKGSLGEMPSTGTHVCVCVSERGGGGVCVGMST